MTTEQRSFIPTSEQLAEAIPGHLEWLREARRESDRRLFIVFLVGFFGVGMPTAACLAPHLIRALGN